MAGVLVKIDDAEFKRRMENLRTGVERPSPLMKIWGEIAHRSITKNFDVGGRPQKWQPLSRITIKIKGHAKPLIGATGQLKNIVVQPGETSVLVGSNPAARDYAAIQQFGGNAGRRRKVRPGTVRGAILGGIGSAKIPARPYILLQDEDTVEMGEEAKEFFKRIGS